MNDNDIWTERYKQMNERSRWYTSQLWYVPFAYVALVGLGLEKILALPTPLKGLALTIVALLSFATFVHISSVKYFERLTVRELRRLEEQRGCAVSIGGSPWYLSFFSYLRLIPLIGCYAFVWLATAPGILIERLQCPVRLVAVLVLVLMTVIVFYKDIKRNKDVVCRIRPPMGIEKKSEKSTATQGV